MPYSLAICSAISILPDRGVGRAAAHGEIIAQDHTGGRRCGRGQTPSRGEEFGDLVVRPVAALPAILPTSWKEPGSSSADAFPHRQLAHALLAGDAFFAAHLLGQRSRARNSSIWLSSSLAKA